MKINWNKKYNTYAAYACLVGAIIICFIFAGIYFDGVINAVKRLVDVCAPLIYGAAIGYILNPICKFFENKVLVKIKWRKVKRGISMLLSYSILFALVALLVYALIPEIARSFNDLQNNLIIYANSLQEWVNSISDTSPQLGAVLKSLMDYIDFDSISGSITQLFESLSDILTALAPVILSYAEIFAVQLKNIVLGFIFSAYFLASKELIAAQVRKLGHAIINPEKYSKMSYFIRFSDHTFGKYLMGTLVDSILVACEFLIVLNIFRFPYAPLVSIVCGVTNMIPIFGPFIGAIPSFLIIFISDPIKAFWFILIVLAIQQIDGNIIAPRIIGESTGLSAIAVISAVTIMGGLFGIPGMVIGVPLCAVFANIINNKTDEKLKQKEAELNQKNGETSESEPPKEAPDQPVGEAVEEQPSEIPAEQTAEETPDSEPEKEPAVETEAPAESEPEKKNDASAKKPKGIIARILSCIAKLFKGRRGKRKGGK